MLWPCDQRHQVGAQYNAEHITVYAQATPRPVDPAGPCRGRATARGLAA